MSHDVLISYSTRRQEAADNICELLEANGIVCWMAPRDIRNEQYATAIYNGIKGCKAMVLVFSEPAARSPWVINEVAIAHDMGKPIIPYIIEEVELEAYPEFYTRLASVQQIKSLLGYESRINDLEARIRGILNQNPPPGPNPPQPPKQRYKVGDYYNENGKRGVVFYVDETGESGKIVSMQEAIHSWAIDKEYGTLFNSNNPIANQVGADSQTDGLVNMRVIQAIEGWQEKYPAFAWCASLGTYWYLPAIDELKLLLLNDSVHDAVNKTLKEKGGMKLANKKDGVYYNSSTEHRYYGCAWIVAMNGGHSYDGCKGYTRSVRAVSSFGAASQPTINETQPPKQPTQPQPRKQCYKVGDYYNENGKRGVVFYVDESGVHGKIVSMKAAKHRWAINKEYGFFNGGNPSEKEIGADNRVDGMVNMRVIQAIKGWRKKYPAFAWCASLGADWYLPAIDELKLLLLNDSVHDAVNKTLIEKDGIMLADKNDRMFYWSSTENGNAFAWDVLMGNGYTGNGSKSNYGYVRAVSAF